MTIGLYFGSFNPIHIGHIIVANYMVEFTSIKNIWMIISPCNPFKIKKKLLDPKLRFQIIQETIKKYHNIHASDIELNLPIPSYTYDTLYFIKNKYPDIKFAIVMGYKNFLIIHKWKNYEYIIQNFDIYTYPELGDKNYNSIIKFTNKKEYILAKAPIISISSSFIRKHIIENKNINFLLPQQVWKYIPKIKKYFINHHDNINYPN